MIDIDQMQHNARCAVKLLKAMSNETRMMILCELLRGERSVSELEERIGISQSALSQHLARLRRYALVSTRRSSQTIYYSLNGTEVPVVIEALYRLFCEDPDHQRAPGSPASRNAALQEA
jgi:DNA-binding transcriptional ArsR family regulator